MKGKMNPQATLTIFAKERNTALGDLFSIFFEDLNHAADGGLYAELVQNRSFEFDPIDNKGNTFVYEFPKQSINIFRLAKIV